MEQRILERPLGVGAVEEAGFGTSLVEQENRCAQGRCGDVCGEMTEIHICAAGTPSRRQKPKQLCGRLLGHAQKRKHWSIDMFRSTSCAPVRVEYGIYRWCGVIFITSQAHMGPT